MEVVARRITLVSLPTVWPSVQIGIRRTHSGWARCDALGTSGDLPDDELQLALPIKDSSRLSLCRRTCRAYRSYGDSIWRIFATIASPSKKLGDGPMKVISLSSPYLMRNASPARPTKLLANMKGFPTEPKVLGKLGGLGEVYADGVARFIYENPTEKLVWLFTAHHFPTIDVYSITRTEAKGPQSGTGPSTSSWPKRRCSRAPAQHALGGLPLDDPAGLIHAADRK